MNRRRALFATALAATTPATLLALPRQVINIQTKHPSVRLELGGMKVRFWIDFDPKSFVVRYCAITISAHNSLRYPTTIMERLRASGLLQPENASHNFFPIESGFLQTGNQPRVDILTLPFTVLEAIGVTSEPEVVGHVGKFISWQVGTMKGRKKVLLPNGGNAGTHQVAGGQGVGVILAGSSQLQLESA